MKSYYPSPHLVCHETDPIQPATFALLQDTIDEIYGRTGLSSLPYTGALLDRPGLCTNEDEAAVQVGIHEYRGFNGLHIIELSNVVAVTKGEVANGNDSRPSELVTSLVVRNDVTMSNGTNTQNKSSKVIAGRSVPALQTFRGSIAIMEHGTSVSDQELRYTCAALSHFIDDGRSFEQTRSKIIIPTIFYG